MKFNEYAENRFKYDEELRMNVLAINKSCSDENLVVIYAHKSKPNKVLLGIRVNNSWRPLTHGALISNPLKELSVAKVEYIKFINKLKKERIRYEL